jgi:hypothetical protein
MSWGRSNFLPAGYMPNSQVVQSDDEFMNQWRQQMDAVPDQVVNTAAQKAYTPWFQQGAANAIGGGDGALAAEKAANSFGLTLSNNGDGVFAGKIAGYETPMMANPDKAAAGAGFSDAVAKRQEDQKRQTQAYGQMQGGNYFGGFIDNRYGEAFNGQMQQGNGDPTSGGATPAAPGQSGFGETFGAKPRQYRAGAWGSYGW